MYEGVFYPDYLTVGGASYAIVREAEKHCLGKGVDIGAGYWPLPGAQSVDIWRGPGQLLNIDNIPDGSLDYVFSSHTLEHITDWKTALNIWIGKVRKDGVVFLYLPHPGCAIWHPGSPFVGDGHKWKPEPLIVKNAMREAGCDVFAWDDGPDAMQSFYVCGRRST
jgi:hypothetical protein